MVDVNSCVQIRILLSYRTAPDLIDKIFSFLPYFVHGWHKKPPMLTSLALPLPRDYCHPSTRTVTNPVVTFTPYEIVFRSREELVKMQQIDFTLTFFVNTAFYPPYSTLYEKWRKKIGRVQANYLQQKYSVEPDECTYYSLSDKFIIEDDTVWTSKARKRLNNVFREHALLEDLPFPVTKDDQKQHEPITLTVSAKPGHTIHEPKYYYDRDDITNYRACRTNLDLTESKRHNIIRKTTHTKRFNPY